MIIKNKLKNLLKNNTYLFGIAQDAYIFILKIMYIISFYHKRVDEKKIIFQAFMGKQYSDSPRALYRCMLLNDKWKDYTFVWILENDKNIPQELINSRTKIVRYRSNDYYNEASTSKYWISNSRMRSELIKKKSQIYVQTWHGTPLKKLGFDIGIKDFKDIGGNQKRLTKNYLDDAKRYDYLISQSKYFTEKISSAFGFNKLSNKIDILEYGYPRNDVLFDVNNDYKNEIYNKLGIDKDKRIILYAPTFRENNIIASEYNFNLELDIDRMVEKCDNSILLLRLHYYVSSRLDIKNNDRVIDVSSYSDISDLYLISDLLITDYSSVFFDYSILNKPIIFYMYDKEIYESKMHDFYLDFSELPGAIVQNNDDLIKQTLLYLGKDFNHDEFNKRFNPHKGAVSDRILSKILREA